MDRQAYFLGILHAMKTASIPESYVPFGYPPVPSKRIDPTDQETHTPSKQPSPDRLSGVQARNIISNYRDIQE